MKKILFIICFFGFAVCVNAQSSNLYKLYAIRQNTNGTIDSIDRKLFTDSLFLRTVGTFVGMTKEYYTGFYEPEYPDGFANFVPRGDGIWINQNMLVNNTTVVPSTVQAAMNNKAPLVHSHTYNTLTDLPVLFDGAYSSLTGVPSTFTPAAHTHATSEISGLDAALNAKANLVSPAFTTPNIGAATGTSITVTGNIRTSAGSIGYASGAGGAVTQTGNKGTAVTINKISGQITTTNAALAAGAEVSFNVNNNTVALNDVVVISMQGGGTVSGYMFSVSAVGSGLFTITISNISTGSLSQALVINFVVIKGVNN